MSRIPFDIELLGAPQEDVANRVRSLRESMGLSLREFARLLSKGGHPVSHTAVVKFERLELKVTPDYLERVSRATEVSYGWLLSGKNSGDSCGGHPILSAAGLESLPAHLHDSVSARLEKLANWCGISASQNRSDFYRRIGAIIRAPFLESASFVRPWEELSEREQAAYLTKQFDTLQNVLSGTKDRPRSSPSLERKRRRRQQDSEEGQPRPSPEVAA